MCNWLLALALGNPSHRWLRSTENARLGLAPIFCVGGDIGAVATNDCAALHGSGDRQLGADRSRAIAHSAQTNAAGTACLQGNSTAIVADFDSDLVHPHAKEHMNSPCSGMRDGIRQRFLDNAEQLIAGVKGDCHRSGAIFGVDDFDRSTLTGEFRCQSPQRIRQPALHVTDRRKTAGDVLARGDCLRCDRRQLLEFTRKFRVGGGSRARETRGEHRKAGQFLAEVGQLSNRVTLVDGTAEGDVVTLLIPPEGVRSLLVAEADLGERIMRALILRRVSLLQKGAGGPVLIGPAFSNGPAPSFSATDFALASTRIRGLTA